MMSRFFLNKNIYTRRRSKEIANRININSLKKIFIFKELKNNENFLQELLNYCEIIKVNKGDTVYTEGDKSHDLYIILDGSVRVYKKTNTGEEFLVAELTGKLGGFFGEMGLINHQPRTATVRAESDTKLLVLPRKGFIGITQKQPAIAMGLTFSICQVLAARLQRTNADLSYLYDALACEASEV